MNSFDRCEAALNLEEPDRVPYYPVAPSATLSEYNLAMGSSISNIEFCRKVLKADMIRVNGRGPPGGWKPKSLGSGLWVDEWGRVMRYALPANTEARKYGVRIEQAVDYPIKSMDDLEAYSVPDPKAEGRLDHVETTVGEYGNEMMVAGSVESAFCWSAYLTGFEKLLRDLYVNPTLVHKVVKLTVDYWLETGKATIDVGCRNVWIVDDFAYKQGPMFSTKHFENFFFPGIKRMAEAFKKRGATVVLHSDGDVTPFIKYLIDAGIDGLNPIEPSCMSLEAFKETWGNRLCPIGNVDTETILIFGSEDDVRREILRCIEQGSPGGGYILSGGGPTGYVPLKNVLAVTEMLNKYGAYPMK